MKRDLTEDPLIIKKPRGKWCFNLSLALSLPAGTLPPISVGVCRVNSRREEFEGPKRDQDAI